MPDRFTHAADHWSLAVADGQALDARWRAEPPIPHGGHHRASAVVDGQLYSLGGQERDIRPIPGDPMFTCDWSTPDEILYSEVYAYCPQTRAWRTCAPMPETSTHAEFSSFARGRFIWVFGGIADRYTLKSTVQVYDTRTDRWKIAGHHPYPLKGHVALPYEKYVFSFCGQCSVSATDPRPGDVLASGWKAKLPDPDALFGSA
jgi:N-acetylneuraminic acid mutarotase